MMILEKAVFLARVAAFLMGVGCLACAPPASDSASWKVGGYYWLPDREGAYRVVKILVLDDQAVHLRIYKNRFAEPEELDPSTLSLGSINDPEGFGIGHIPMARQDFANSRPEYSG